MRPWLNWREQQISNLWVAGSSPAGRAIKIKSGLSRFYFCVVRRWTRTEESCVSNEGSTTSRFDKRSAIKSLRLTHRQNAERVLLGAPQKLNRVCPDFIFVLCERGREPKKVAKQRRFDNK